VLGDQAQLADLGLERGGTDDRRHHGGQADHLGHPAAGLAGGEVGADPGPQVLALADVEDLAALVDELVDPRQSRQRLGQVPLGPLLRRDPGREGRQLVQRADAEVAQPFEHAVQHVDGRARVGQRAVVGRGAGPEQAREAGQLAVGRLVAGDDLDGRGGRCPGPGCPATRARSARRPP
jgi:hypothetical protein